LRGIREISIWEISIKAVKCLEALAKLVRLDERWLIVQLLDEVLQRIYQLESPFAKQSRISYCFHFKVQPRFAGSRTQTTRHPEEVLPTFTARHLPEPEWLQCQLSAVKMGRANAYPELRAA
jgi:hypothetical protein